MLGEDVAAAGDLGRLGAALGRALLSAEKRIDVAEARLVEGRSRAARKALGKALRSLAGFRSRLGSRAAERRIAPATRAALIRQIEGLIVDLRALRRST